MTRVSRSIGPYRILEPLGHGGMGTVYRAQHERSGGLAALKTVRVPRSGLLQSIRREIHALTQLRHPGIVKIFDEGLEDCVPWYAMEMVQGQSLRHWSAAGHEVTRGAGVSNLETLDLEALESIPDLPHPPAGSADTRASE